MAESIDKLRPLPADIRNELMSKAGVVATGIGYKITNGQKTGEPAVICSVETKKPSGMLREKDRIASHINGVTTDVVQTGLLTAFQDRTARYRPAPGGISIGHYQVSAGTLGCLVKKNDTVYILSNNHVLANSNDASPGDPVLQPGSHDGGRRPEDVIASLADFVPIRFETDEDGDISCPVSGFITSVLNAASRLTGSSVRMRRYRATTENNLVDCAIAKPDNPDDVQDEILEIGTIGGVAEGTLDLAIKKSGRTTGLTTGTIEQVDVTARVNFGSRKVAVFEDQLMAGRMSDGGDSGSVVLDTDNNIVGLLFAGSATTTIINRIQHVFSKLEVGLR